MIAKLSGVIDFIGTDHLILDVNGVGYLVFASAKTLSRIGSKGSKASMLIETHVREEHIKLYGFADADEKDWFTLLCTVQGVGTRVCMSILSVASPQDLLLGITAQDKALLTAAEGVGPKLALRILTELKDKAGKMTLSSGSALHAVPSSKSEGTPYGHVNMDAVSALVNLGYGQSEAFKAVSSVCANSDEEKNIGVIITESLKKLGTA